MGDAETYRPDEDREWAEKQDPIPELADRRRDERVEDVEIEEVSIDVPAPATGTLASVEGGDNGELRRGDVPGYVRPA